jgi:hypothetical protein
MSQDRTISLDQIMSTNRATDRATGMIVGKIWIGVTAVTMIYSGPGAPEPKRSWADWAWG